VTRRVVLLLCTVIVPPLAAQSPPSCSTVEQCRQLAAEAITAGHFETAHDLAWLAYQKGSKQDPITLTLIARAQSLSGRGDDAFVMLKRLADAGVVVEEAKEGNDFRAARAHAQWPQLLAAYEAGGEKAEVSTASNTGKPSSKAAAAVPENTPSPAAPAPPAAAKSGLPRAADADLARSGDDLSMPAALAMPATLAYDAVSARFVMSTASSDALTVLSQTSSNAAPFTSRGWSGHDVTTALAIDRGAGDLWVAVHGTAGMALHRLQLISGRRLEIIEVPDEPRAELASLVSTVDGLYALDVSGRRIFRRLPQAKKLDVVTTFAAEIAPTALAYTRNALYVAHAAGVLRIDNASRRQRAVSFSDKDALAGLHSIAVHDGVLFGTKRAGDRWTVVRVRLNQAGTAATNVATVGPAMSPAATLANGIYYYVASDGDGSGPALRGVTVK
jgi:hypothetical protein